MSDAAAHKVREWLLAILRFVITLDRTDRAAALSLAREMDSLGLSAKSTFTFFVRTSTRLCDCIAAEDSPEKIAFLRRCLSNIDDDRLRVALAAAFEIERSAKRHYRARGRSRAGCLEVSAKPENSFERLSPPT
jgi:hypothetical protein